MVESDHCSPEEDLEEQGQHERAMKLSNYANTLSGSIAIAASTLDSLLDLLVGGILWCTHWTVKNVNIYKYPIGKLRVQPVGIIIFAAVMSTLVFQVLIEAVQELGKDEEPTKMSTIQLAWLYSIMIGATLVKLGLWICCRSSGNTIGPCMRQDDYFEVITHVVGLVVAVRGDKYFWWIDPPDAILLAVCTIKNWSETVWENAGAYLPNSSQPSTMIA
ncbi:ZT dimer domain-containing protein [Citrus sinensis]|uniref:ZT dimer domain-containing protein n=1 Tax=Citrus sinensis TaxID=2711 RepID=A0ACB8IQ23_CITSI|nr:ZT dimer domain-containing protein [Citrus sinensis]